MTESVDRDLGLPGCWIDHPDRDWAFVAQMLLAEVTTQLAEAAVVLGLFLEAGKELSSSPRDSARMRSLYARSFVYSLDTIGQLIRVLQGSDQLPPSAREQCQRWLAEFGALRELRNSLQHIEDRLRGLGRRGTPLPKPLVILGAFRNNLFGGTTAEGTYVEVDVSASVLCQARAIIEDLLWSFQWLGPGSIPVHREGLDG